MGRIMTYNNELIVEKYYNNPVLGPVCEDKGTGIFHENDPTALLFNLRWNARANWDENEGYSGAWEIHVWKGGWQKLATVPTAWSVAPSPEYGQEIFSAINGDLNNIAVPLNFAHHVVIGDPDFNNTGPWHEAYLGHPLNGRSKTRADGPLSATDLAGDDRTSISSCVPNSDNLCD